MYLLREGLKPEQDLHREIKAEKVLHHDHQHALLRNGCLSVNQGVRPDPNRVQYDHKQRHVLETHQLSLGS